MDVKQNIKQMLKSLLPRGTYSYLRRVNAARHAFVERYKNFQDEWTIEQLLTMYEEQVEQIKSKVRKTGKIRIGFFVVRDSQWANRPLFEAMISHPVFEPFAVACPETTFYHAEEDLPRYCMQTYEKLVSQYSKEHVICGYDPETEKYIDVMVDYDLDLCAFSTFYTAIKNKIHGSHEFYCVEHAIKKKKLSFFNAYGYQAKINYDILLLKTYPACYRMWKLFSDNKEEIALGIENMPYVYGKNMVLSGYCKMDKYFAVEKSTVKNDKKTILISPHHSILPYKIIQTGNFFKYYNFYLELFQKYPEVQFIFRPHPALWTTLRQFDEWGGAKVDEYIKIIKSFQNVEYSDGGEYFDLFAKSDALITDCVSWFAEYFYTGKPQCYVLRDESELYTEYLEFGREFFEHVYKAFGKNDITDFIENVILKGNDSKKEARDIFAKERVMINYPHVSDFIVDYFENVFEIKDMVKQINYGGQK